MPSKKPPQIPPQIPQEVFDLYDDYAHGGMDRRAFFDRLTKYAVGGVSTAALAAAVLPDYSAAAMETSPDDAGISVESFTYASPKGGGEITGDLVVPTRVRPPLGTVLVIHENRGLNPYVKDVARRVGLAGYIALAPDALSPLGGYPGNDDDGRTMQRKRDRVEMLEDFMAGAQVLRGMPEGNGKVACVGFCFGGSMANMLAVKLPWLAGAVPFYGGWPTAQEAAQVQVPLMIQLAGLDKRVNGGWPAYETALLANNKGYSCHMYEGVNHGFHNNTTPRYDAPAATLAWARTLDFFGSVLS